MLVQVFQSAPGREAGRCPTTGPRVMRIFLFQSAPGREAGRCPLSVRVMVSADIVSIRARP